MTLQATSLLYLDTAGISGAVHGLEYGKDYLMPYGTGHYELCRPLGIYHVVCEKPGLPPPLVQGCAVFPIAGKGVHSGSLGLAAPPDLQAFLLFLLTLFLGLF